MSGNHDDMANSHEVVGSVSSRFGMSQVSLPTASLLPHLILVAALLLQAFAFYQSAIRDLENVYPFAFDQAQYLTQSYAAFDVMRQDGILAGLKFSLLHPQRPAGVLLQTEAALLYVFLGASRSTSLLLLLLHFFALQVVLFFAFRKLFGRSTPAFVAIGLLLTTIGRHYYAGGIQDFRLDFPAVCLYGIALCALICSNRFKERSWATLFTVAVVLLATTRFIALAYLLPAIFLTIILWGAVEFRRTRSWRSALPILRASRWPILGAGLLIAPAILSRLEVLQNYYVVGHVTGPEKSIRAQQMGVTDLLSSLLFYPKSLVVDHLGILFSCALVVCLLFGLLLRQASRRSELAMTSSIHGSGESIATGIIWLLLPLVLYNLDEAKSPVVAGVCVGPVIVLAGMIYGLLSMHTPSQKRYRRLHSLETAAVGVLLVVSVGFAASSSVRRNPYLLGALDATGVNQMYGELADQLGGRSAAQPVTFATDALLDYFNVLAIQTMVYERTGKMVNAQELLATGLFETTRDKAIDALRRSDYAALTLANPALDANPVFPFNRQMISLRPELLAVARREMIPWRTISNAGHHMQLFRRAKAQINGNSGQWLLSTGTSVVMDAAAARRFGHLLLSGTTILSEQLSSGLRCQAYVVDGQSQERRSIPAVSSLANGAYDIAIDLSNLPDQFSETLEVFLEFPTYFVPSERSINADGRKLVVFAPNSLRFVPAKSLYPPGLQKSPPPEPAPVPQRRVNPPPAAVRPAA
jgi:hypothetical protein